MEDDIKKFMELKETHKKNSEKKIRIEERLKTANEDLKKLVAEIKAAGYDPKNIKEELANKEKDFQEKLKTFELEVQQNSEALNKIED